MMQDRDREEMRTSGTAMTAGSQAGMAAGAAIGGAASGIVGWGVGVVWGMFIGLVAGIFIGLAIGQTGQYRRQGGPAEATERAKAGPFVW